jgi:LacI family transcriptional regulator
VVGSGTLTGRCRARRARRSRCIVEGNYLLGDGYRQTCALPDYADPPTAIVAGDDAQAAGVYRALTERDIKIPTKMSVIGFDDVMYSAQMPPPLTTIRQPLAEIGRMATNMLLRLIDGETLEATHVELSTSLGTVQPKAG